jgi:hypothetical protein
MIVNIEHNAIVAENENDKLVLRIMFNCGIVRGAYILGLDASKFPDWLDGGTGYLLLNKNNILEMPGTGQEKAQKKIEEDIKREQEKKHKEADDILSFLNL